MANTQAHQAPSIEIFALTKRYPSSSSFALQDLNVRIFPGEVYGFLGPNGAGKSTTIKLLMNFLQPTAGGATILGKDIVKDSVELKSKIGYLAGDISLYPKMTGEQFLRYMSELQPATSQKYLNSLVKRFKMDSTKKLGELSRGNRQKVAIVQAFMHQPEILVLDEPTSGLDPLMQEEFFSLIKEAKDRGSTVFVSSHIMSEVQRMCDRVGIIRDGKLAGEYSIAELVGEMSQTFDISFEGKQPTAAELSAIDGIRIVSQKDSELKVHMKGHLSPLLKVISKYDVTKITAESLDLEETFLHFYRQEEDNDQQQKNK